MVDKYGVRTISADWGTNDERIGRLMDALQGSRTIPLLAIFPAGRPNEPVIFQAAYSKEAVIKALKEASRRVDASPQLTGRFAPHR